MKSAPTDTATDRLRAGKRWRKLRRVAAGLALALVLTLALPGLWLPGALESVAPWALRRFAGLELQLESVDVATWSRLQVRGLQLRSPGADPWLDVRAPHAIASFTLLDLGSDPLAAIHALEMHDAQVFIDVSSGADSQSTGSGAAPAWPALLPQLDVRNLEFELRGIGAEPLTASALDVLCADGRALTVRFAELHPAGLLQLDDLRRGELRTNYAAGNWRAVELRVDDQLLVHETEIDLSQLHEGALTLDVHVALDGAHATGRARLQAEQWSGDLELSGLRLAWLAPLIPGSTELTGFADLTGDWSFPTSSVLAGRGTAQLTVRELSINGAPNAEFAGALDWDSNIIRSDRVQIHQGLNHAELTDFRWTGNEFSMASLQFALSANARDLPALVLIAGGPPAQDDLPDHELALEAHLANGVLHVDRGTLDTAGGRLIIEQGVITQHATPEDPRHLEAKAEFDDLAELGRLFSVGHWSGSLQGDIVFHDEGSGPELRCELVGAGITIEDHELGAIDVDGVYTPPLLVISELKSVGPAGKIDGGLVLDWTGRHLHEVDLEFALQDLSRLAPRAGIEGSATGSLRLDGPFAALNGNLALEATDLRYRGWEFSEGNLQASVTDGDVRLGALHLADHAARADLSGDLIFDDAGKLREVALESFSIAVEESNLTLASPARFAWDGATARVEGLQLNGSAGSLGAELVWGPDEREIRIVARELKLDQLVRGRRLAEFGLDGMDGEIQFRIENELARGHCDLQVHGLDWPRLGTPIDFRLGAVQANRRLTIDTLNVSDANGTLFSGTAALPLAPLSDNWLPDGDLALELSTGRPLANFLGAALGHPQTEGSLSAQLQLGGTVAAPTGTLETRLDALSWAPGPDRPALGPASLDLRAVLKDDTLRIERGTASLQRAEAVTLEGNLHGPADLHRWLSGAPPPLTELELDLSCAISEFDWQSVAVQLDRLSGTRTPIRTGMLDAQLSVSGSLAEPQLDGTAHLSDGSARLGGLPSIAEVNADLQFHGQAVELERCTGELGGSAFVLTGSVARSAQGLQVDARLVGDELLVVRQGGTRLRANVDATVSGKLSALTIAGSAVITEGVYSTPINVTGFLGGPRPVRARGIQLFRIGSGPLADARFDLEVGTAPESSFLISTTTYKGGLRPDLHLGGTGALPVMTGTVYFDPAVVSLPATRLRVTSGTLIFDESNPFVPTLRVQAASRIRGFDVSASIAGPFDATEITLSSEPPLNSTELLNLVLTGQVPGDDTTRAGEVAQQLAAYLAKDFLAWYISPEPSDKSSDSLMDRIEVITGEDISKSGASTVEGRFRFAEDVTRDDDALYLVAQRDEYDFYNFGIRISFRIK